MDNLIAFYSDLFSSLSKIELELKNLKENTERLLGQNSKLLGERMDIINSEYQNYLRLHELILLNSRRIPHYNIGLNFEDSTKEVFDIKQAIDGRFEGQQSRWSLHQEYFIKMLSAQYNHDKSNHMREFNSHCDDIAEVIKSKRYEIITCVVRITYRVLKKPRFTAR